MILLKEKGSKDLTENSVLLILFGLSLKLSHQNTQNVTKGNCGLSIIFLVVSQG